MITGDQIQEVWKRPIPAIKKLEWHSKWRNGMKCIQVIITGFRIERKYLKVYFSYIDKKGTIVHGIDIASQFKIKK